MPKTNRKQAFATSLWQLADLVNASDRRRSFRARAYRRAVWSLDNLSSQLDEQMDQIVALPGIGIGIASLIEEFRETGSLGELERLASLYPSDARRIARLPRMTPGRQQILKAEYGIDRFDQLLPALDDGTVSGLSGVGPATAILWRQILLDRPSFSARPIQEAASFAQALAQHIEAHVPGAEIKVGGGIGHLDEWIELVELEANPAELERTNRFLAQSALAGRLVSEDPLVVATPSGLTATISAAPSRKMESPEVPLPPDLIRVEDLRGDLHLHTTWSGDGHLDPSDLIAAAGRLGYSYVVITDHTIGLRMGGLDAAALKRQRQELQDIDTSDLWVLQGAELNIDREGGLDLDDPDLADLDFAIAAVHSFFSLDRSEQTARVIKAIEHPAVRVVAHLTGRRIGLRPPIEVELEPILEAAARTGTALEVNGHLDRLDLSATMVDVARHRGVLFAANSDAHRPDELSNIRNAVGVLRRAGVEPGQVVNTWPVDRFREWIRR